MIAALLFAVLEQTTPPSSDTAGYWQQRADYAIVARLDERRGVLVAAGTLRYTNHSPDTLREMFLHQHLNAFRPGSAWSRADEREGRRRFQRLGDPDHAFERFVTSPVVDGQPVLPEYPGAPDSTVVRLPLPRPVAPGATIEVKLAWEARPSTLPRRQGRRGRHYDFAQWYPKVAVYDRGGWQPNALVPQGEFYGEFGDFDVTLVVREDQVIGATGVPVRGDPGWQRARRWGTSRSAANAYGAADSATVAVPAGYKLVRFVAEGVHHFGFSLSPEYRYEGGTYVRAARPAAGSLAFAPFDTVSIHVLYRPGDEREWGDGKVVERTRNTLAWLERIYGAYGYPQMTVLHRIEGGGTEFPMMQMNGSPSQGLNLHEGGHIYSYGLLANNEWRSGWMDEGLTSYQTSWAQALTRHDRARLLLGLPLPPLAAPPSTPRPDTGFLAGYRRRGLRPASADRTPIEQHRLALTGRAEPIGTRADRFSEFGMYTAMIYTRAEMMFGALRDAIGEPTFAAFLRDYYARWAFRHVDETAMRASAERACSCELGWFFAQWVHRVGAIDYALVRVRTERRADAYVTRARVRRRGDYRHPIAVGARVGASWTLVRADPMRDVQEIEITTGAPPDEVRLDPLRTSEDWYRPNDVTPAIRLFDRRRETVRLELPLVDQALADRHVTTVLPFAWYSTPGGVTPAVRLRSSYQGWARRVEAGLGVATGEGLSRGRVQGWLVSEDSVTRWPRRAFDNMGVWALDGLARIRLERAFDRNRMVLAPRTRRGSLRLSLDAIRAVDARAKDALRWSDGSAEALARLTGSVGRVDTMARAWRLELAAGLAEGDAMRGYYRVEYEGSAWRRAAGRRVATRGRVYLAAAPGHTPPERRVYASSRSPAETFGNHYLRARGAPLASSDPARASRRAGDAYAHLGGAGLRGYHQLLSLDGVIAANGEVAYALWRTGTGARPLRVEAGAFADAAYARGVRLAGGPRLDAARDDRVLADAGVGLALRGWLLDRDVRVRLDIPLLVRQPALSVGARSADPKDRVRLRLALSLADLW